MSIKIILIGKAVESDRIYSGTQMDSLSQAIIDGRPTDVRQIIDRDRNVLTNHTPIGTTMLELAQNKGVIETIVVLLHNNAPGTEQFEHFADLLSAYIMEISESWTLTSWYSGIEFIIWSLVVGDLAYFKFSEHHHPFSLGSVETSELLFLSRKANGWPTDEGFLSLVAWEKLYEAHRPRLTTS